MPTKNTKREKTRKVKAVKIRQIWAVEYKGEAYYTCVTEDGRMLRHQHNLETGEDSWQVVSVPFLPLPPKRKGK